MISLCASSQLENSLKVLVVSSYVQL